MTSEPVSNLSRLVETIAKLRSPDGCPWDREQTHRSLGRFLLEESYEVLEAIHLDDSAKLKEELGDLLLQIVLNSRIAQDANQFDIEDVAKGINEKMVRRHPHVFGETTLNTAQEVVAQWDELKAKERKQDSSALAGVPEHMPALLKALKISEKAVAQGFEWTNEMDVWKQLESELSEFKEAACQLAEAASLEPAIRDKRLNELDLEMGDVLFTMANLARWHGLNPEESLLRAIAKFKTRFMHMENVSQRPLKELSVSQLEALWSQAKEATAPQNLDEEGKVRR
jgi:tetrapyrrole methylase family protein/MazG family protein